jgi:hypothetical protein
MKYFSSQNGSIYSTKINFVDDNNALVGYDFSGQCCENYGWYIHDKVTTEDVVADSLFNENDDANAINESLKDWTFDTSFFDELDTGHHGYHVCNTAVFRLVNGENELFLHLYNEHNGYYSHGFDFSKDGEIIQTGSI